MHKNPCFTVSNNPAQGYYDSHLRQFVFPEKPTNSKSHALIFEDDYPTESPCCGKNGICSIESNKPALYNLDDVTSIPYCSTSTTLVEHFTMDDEDDGGCPCNKKNKGYSLSTPAAYNDGLVFFNKNKLCIYIGALILLVLVLSFLCFSRFQNNFKNILSQNNFKKMRF